MSRLHHMRCMTDPSPPSSFHLGRELPLDALADAIRTIGCAEFGPALARLTEDVGSYASTVVAAFPQSGRPIRLFSDLPPAEEEATAQPYFDNSYLLDPWYNMAQSGAQDGVYRFSECVPDSFSETEYFQGFYARTRLVDECGIFVRLSPTVCIVMMLGNRDNDPWPRQGVLDGLILLLPCIAELVRKNWGGLSSLASSPSANLTALCQLRGLRGRETEVTALLLRGFSNKLIARELGISPETVKVHRKRINRKLGTTSTREVFAMFFSPESSKDR